MSRAQLTAEEMMRVIDGSGWPLYLSKTYSFSEGDQSPIELVGKDDKGDKISLVFSSIEGDLLLKSRNSKDPLSYIAGDFWLLPKCVHYRYRCLSWICRHSLQYHLACAAWQAGQATVS